MTVQEMKKKLIELYKSKQLTRISRYTKKLSGMVVSQVNQEYDLVVLGKEYKPAKVNKPKKEKKSKHGLGVEIEESRMKDDIKDVW